MSIYTNDYIAKAKKFELKVEEKDDLIAFTIDTYDKRTIIMTEAQVRSIVTTLSEYLKKRTTKVGAREPGDDVDDLD